MQTQQPLVIYLDGDKQTTAKCNKCLQNYLGQRINLSWDRKKAIMRLQPRNFSQNLNGDLCVYRIDGQQENIENCYFEHGNKCPLLDNEILKNQDKGMKPCACVLLFDSQSQQFLVTKRSSKLRSYPNAWVLPGGHLQKEQGLLEGGIRQCEEEVGLKKQDEKQIDKKLVMVWESVYAIDSQIKACAIVVFFILYCKKFEVKIDPNEVSEYKWKKIFDNSDQKLYDKKLLEGYAEGHLKFLDYVRKYLKKGQQK